MNNTGDNGMHFSCETTFGAIHVSRVVGLFDISYFGDLPFGSWTVKVVKESGGFKATPNVVVRNTATKCMEHTCGIGTTIGEAIAKSVELFLYEASRQKSNKAGILDEADFVWLNWQPYESVQ